MCGVNHEISAAEILFGKKIHHLIRIHPSRMDTAGGIPPHHLFPVFTGDTDDVGTAVTRETLRKDAPLCGAGKDYDFSHKQYPLGVISLPSAAYVPELPIKTVVNMSISSPDSSSSVQIFFSVPSLPIFRT